MTALVYDIFGNKGIPIKSEGGERIVSRVPFITTPDCRVTLRTEYTDVLIEEWKSTLDILNCSHVFETTTVSWWIFKTNKTFCSRCHFAKWYIERVQKEGTPITVGFR